MNILALPGINPKTEKWATNLLNELQAPGRFLLVQKYKHWDCFDSELCLDLPGEVLRLEGLAANLLIAKSLGVIIGLQACGKKIITPERAVFIGTPISNFRENNLDLSKLVASLNIPCLFIQQSHDIVGSCAELRTEIAATPGVEIVEIPGDNHQYKDLKLLVRHIKRWI